MKIKFNYLFGTTLTILPSTWLSMLGVALLLGLLAAQVLNLSTPDAVLVGVVSALLLYPLELLHQSGHAFAAQRVGYPMSEIIFYSPLAWTTYPEEPELPRSTHVKRALGGPLFSVLANLILIPVAFSLWSQGGPWAWVAGFIAAYNLFVMTIGAFLPIPLPGGAETDGGTLLRLWHEKQAEKQATAK